MKTKKSQWLTACYGSPASIHGWDFDGSTRCLYLLPFCGWVEAHDAEPYRWGALMAVGVPDPQQHLSLRAPFPARGVPERSLVLGHALEIGSTAGLHRQASGPALCSSWTEGQLATIQFVSPESQDDPRPPAITELLQRWRGGSQEALEALIPTLYQELLRIARAHMKGERPGHTLEPSALVNEAYARLIDVKLDWQDRVHFLSVASRTMRRVLVDHARAKQRDKRAGGAIRVTLSDGIAQSRGEEILHLEDALEALGKRYPRKRDVVEMHFFGGLKYAEIAAAAGISEATVDRELRFAKAFLGRELAGGTQAEP